jgi:hypothetical protein
MSNGISFPNFSGQPGMRFETMVVTEASVSAAAFSTAGLDTRGSFLATIKDLTGGIYQVVFNQTYADAPLVVPMMKTFNTQIELTTVSSSGFTFRTALSDANGTPVTTAVVGFFLCLYTSNQVFA